MITELTLPFFNKLNENEKMLIKKNMYEKSYKKGEVMHAGSNDCNGLFFIKSGHVRVFILSENGKEITLYRLFEGDICIFSASCVLKDISFEVFVEAQADTKCIIIPPDIYFNISKNSAEIAEYTNQLMSSRFSDVMWLIEQIVFSSFDKRLAEFIISLSAIEQSDTLNITHEEIAKNLGTAREVVTRMLKYFSNEKMVELFRGGIKITDRKKILGLIK